MEKKVIDIELYYIPKDYFNQKICKSFKLNQDDRIILKNTIHRYACYFWARGFKRISKDYNIELDRENVNIFQLKSNISEEIEAVVEIHIKPFLLNEAAKKRLIELGYDENEAKKYYCRSRYWTYYCSVVHGEKLYTDFSFGNYVFQQVEQLIIELRNKEAMNEI